MKGQQSQAHPEQQRKNVLEGRSYCRKGKLPGFCPSIFLEGEEPHNIPSHRDLTRKVGHGSSILADQGSSHKGSVYFLRPDGFKLDNQTRQSPHNLYCSAWRLDSNMEWMWVVLSSSCLHSPHSNSVGELQHYSPSYYFSPCRWTTVLYSQKHSMINLGWNIIAGRQTFSGWGSTAAINCWVVLWGPCLNTRWS